MRAGWSVITSLGKVHHGGGQVIENVTGVCV